MCSIKEIKYNRKNYLPLLLTADPCEDMIDLYLDKGDMFILFDDNKAICEAVVVKTSEEECELKNIATDEEYHMKGYARKLLDYMFNRYKNDYKTMFVGTTSSTAPFYNKLGFKYSHTVENFFIDNYPERIFEGDVQCIDMIYLKKDL